MNIVKIAVSGFVLLFALLLSSSLVLSAPVAAQSPEQSACEGSGGTWSNGGCSHGTRTVASTLKNVSNILTFLIGAISVVMIIIGGLRYTLSNGDQGALTSAKNTILYAVVGLVVAVASYAIVNFVLKNI